MHYEALHIPVNNPRTGKPFSNFELSMLADVQFEATVRFVVALLCESVTPWQALTGH